VDGAHEHRPETVEDRTPRQLLGAPVDPLLQLCAGFFGERESDDGLRLDAFVQERGRAARYRPGLARPRARDDLEVAATVRNDFLLLGCEVHPYEPDSMRVWLRGARQRIHWQAPMGG
jgi:hypothetical protein